MHVDFTTVALIASLVILALAVWRVGKEPRRVSTGLLIVAGVVMLWFSSASLVYRYDEDAGTIMASGVLYVLVPIALLLVAAAAVANGVVVMRREGIRLANALPLAFGLGSIVLYTLGVVAILNSPPPFTMAVILSVLAVYAYVGFLLAGYTAYSVLYSRLPHLDDVHTLVTLGCSLSGDRPTPLLRSRLDRTLRVGGQGTNVLYVPSGGQGSDEILSEAAGMSTYLQEEGVAAERILMEDRSTTTRENLECTRRLLESHLLPTTGVVVVTSNFHVLRSASLARTLGYDWQVVGAPTARYYVPTAFLREFAAYLTYHRRVHLAMVALLVVPTLVVGLVA